jgi:heptosyltransferase-3
MNRILVIRGGAIGDFVLTLPAIKLLRDRFPAAHLELLGVPHIVALADKRFYAEQVRSLDAAAFAPFFAAHCELPRELSAYFASFDFVVSYLHDADRIFEANVRKCAAATFIAGTAKLDDTEHAAFQLARPLRALGLCLKDPVARIFPTEEDRAAVRHFNATIVLHPGSGSETKNWPIQKWIELGDALLAEGRDVLIVAGEADTARIATLKSAWAGRAVRFVDNLPLPQLAALLEGTTFVGHDSGISHIAAAVKARCILLFGPTEPAIWAPVGDKVTVLRAPHGDMTLLAIDVVACAVTSACS